MAQIVETPVSRRAVLGATGAALAGYYAVATSPVLAQAIHTDTQGITGGDYDVAIGSYRMPVYEARPSSEAPAPIVIVISEIWGVHEYVRDSTRRFAKEGFHAVAPELFKREGGVAQLPNVQDILKIVLAVPRKQLLGDIQAAATWAKGRPSAGKGVGITGWCWGGATVIQAAAAIPDLKAAVAWYGPPGRPYVDTPNPVTGFDVAKDIKIPFLGLYGENDQNPKPEDAKRFGELLKQHNKNVEIVVYPGAGHAFHADYRPSYNAQAAADGWKRCVAHFKQHVKA